MKSIREETIEAGFIPGTPEYKKAYERFRWRRRGKESRANCGNSGHAAIQRRMRRDENYAKKIREKWRKAKERQRKRRGEEINATQREWYKENRQAALETIKRGRHRRDPSRGLATLLRGIKNGDREPAELLEYARTAIDKLNSLGSGSSRRRLSGSRDAGPKNTETERTESGQCSPIGRPTSGDDQAGGGSGRSENEN